MTGELSPRGEFRSEEQRLTLFNDYTGGSTFSPVTGSSRVLIRRRRGRSTIDGNCRLPNSFPWHLYEVLGKLSKKYYLVKLTDSSGHLKLGVVNPRLLAESPSYCPVTIHTRIDGGPECQSHVESRSYGEWYYQDYTDPRESITCGFTVILTDKGGRPVKNLLVGLLVSYDFPPIRQAVTDSSGEATFWVNVAEHSALAIEAPFNHEKFRSSVADVYYEFSTV